MNAETILKSKEKFHITLGLDRIKKILSLLDNPQDKYKTIHIAGTNGKGSTSKIINEILLRNGFKAGLFMSPHIFSYTERIKVNNENISQYVFDKLTNDINSLAKANCIELSEFELITAVAFYYFFIKGVDYVVLETGLGGLLDATNAVKNSIAVITSIDFDHTERLGSTIDEIALQKAGIIKEGSNVIVSDQNKGFEVIKKEAKIKNAKLILAQPTRQECSLLGEHQQLNLSLAIAVADLLNLNYKEAIKNVKHPFRLQYFKDKNILIDSCHNPSGVKTLRDFLDKNFKDEKKTFVFGCLKNKDYKKMLKILLKEGDTLCFMEFNYPNALKYEEFYSSFCNEKYSPRALLLEASSSDASSSDSSITPASNVSDSPITPASVSAELPLDNSATPVSDIVETLSDNSATPASDAAPFKAIELLKIASVDEVLKKEGLKVFCGSIYMLGTIFKERQDIIGNYEEF